METTNDTNSFIKKCGEGDPAFLKVFFEKYSADIYNFPMKVFHLTEDDASDFYIYAFERLKSGKKLKSFEGKSQFRTWFYSVLRNMLIDWQRTKREISIQNKVRKNSEGDEYGGIEDEEDTLSDKKSKAIEATHLFNRSLSNIKLENRVVFKLTYIYYLQLEDDEIQLILNKSGMNIEELKEWILNIRTQLTIKDEEIQKLEDKITTLYLNIMDLKYTLIEEGKNADTSTNLSSPNRIERALEKKYEQRKKLLEKKQKGLFLARTPYKDVGQILGISESRISVTIIRVIEKLQKKLIFE